MYSVRRASSSLKFYHPNYSNKQNKHIHTKICHDPWYVSIPKMLAGVVLYHVPRIAAFTSDITEEYCKL